MTADDRSTLLTQLRRNEGLRLKPYTDTVGKLTIGYGRNLTDNGIHEGEADDMLAHDVDDTIHELAARWPTWITLDGPRQIVLANMAFNMGVPTLLTFVQTLKAIEIGDYAGAAQRMLVSKWARQVGPRAVRLAKIMETGKG